MSLKTRISSVFKVKKYILIASDFVALSVSVLLSSLIGASGLYPVLPFYSYNGCSAVNFYILSMALCMLLLHCSGAYSIWKSPKRFLLYCFSSIIIGKALTYCCVAASSSTTKYLAFLCVDIVLSLLGFFLVHFVLFKNSAVKREPYAENEHPKIVKNALIIGAGRAAEMLLNEVRSAYESKDPDNPALNIDIVGLIDDDANKLDMRLNGVKVIGNSSQIEIIAKNLNVDYIYFAIPSCDPENRQRILQICAKTSAEVFVVPYLTEMIEKFGQQEQLVPMIRKIRIEDLLERAPINLDRKNIKNFISDKVCLVTGGGGSIGSELVRQIAMNNPKTVIIVDIYENNVYDIQQEIKLKYGNTVDLRAVIANVCDYDRIDYILGEYKPDIIFHAAAHKHVPLMESTPEEAVMNNVFGTQNLIELAEKHKVKKFVMISTDKAVNPTNVMGATKRCCEIMIEARLQRPCETEFVITRFGNVLGSNGSVIPLFMRQLENGKPLTVTHPEIIRYFMTIPEAVLLVLEAAAMAEGGEIFVLDMGKPVKILTLAENMIRLYGKKPYTEVPIVFTGLRPGEKLYEELFTNERYLEKSKIDKIFIGHTEEISEEKYKTYCAELDRKLGVLKQAAQGNDHEATLAALKDIVPTFNHKTN